MKTILLLALSAATVWGVAGSPASTQDPIVPGPEHELIARHAGTWDYVQKLRMAPDAEWLEGSGVETTEVVCNGFFISSVMRGTMMDMEMEGRMQLGFDQTKEKYVGTWIDSFGSYLVTFEGDHDAETDTLHFESQMYDPMQQKTLDVTMTSQMREDGTAVFSMYMPGPDGPFLSMETIYTKQ